MITGGITTQYLFKDEKDNIINNILTKLYNPTQSLYELLITNIMESSSGITNDQIRTFLNSNSRNYDTILRKINSIEQNVDVSTYNMNINILSNILNDYLINIIKVIKGSDPTVSLTGTQAPLSANALKTKEQEFIQHLKDIVPLNTLIKFKNDLITRFLDVNNLDTTKISIDEYIQLLDRILIAKREIESQISNSGLLLNQKNKLDKFKILENIDSIKEALEGYKTTHLRIKNSIDTYDLTETAKQRLETNKNTLNSIEPVDNIDPYTKQTINNIIIKYRNILLTSIQTKISDYNSAKTANMTTLRSEINNIIENFKNNEATVSIDTIKKYFEEQSITNNQVILSNIDDLIIKYNYFKQLYPTDNISVTKPRAIEQAELYKTEVEKIIVIETITANLNSILSGQYIDPDILANKITDGINNEIGSYNPELLLKAQEKLQQLRNSWKEDDFKTLLCLTKDSSCINKISPAIMTSGKNGLPHESFNFIEIKINDSQYAYYNKFSSSFISIDINGYVYNKYSNNILNIPPDCIFNKFVLFKGDAKDSCHSCSSTIMTDNQTKINRYIKNLSVEKDFIKKKSEVDSLNQNIFINYNNNYSDPQKHFIKFKLNNGSSSQTYRTMDIYTR